VLDPDGWVARRTWPAKTRYSTDKGQQSTLIYTRRDKIYEDIDMSVLHLFSLTTGRVLSFQSSVLNSDILKQVLKRTSSSINI